MEHIVIDAEGKPVRLPVKVSHSIRTSMQPTLFANGRYIIHESVGTNKLVIHDFHLKKTIHLGSPDRPQAPLIHYGSPSPNQQRVLAVTGTSDPDIATELFVYTINNGKLKKTQKAEITPHIRCYNRCFVQEIKFKDNDTVIYLKRAKVPDPDKSQKEYKEVKLQDMQLVLHRG